MEERYLFKEQLLLVICCFTAFSQAERIFTFGENCSVVVTEFEEHGGTFVEYNGGTVNTSCSKMSFHAEEDTVCVSPEYYDDTNCTTELEYYTTSSNGLPLETFNCSNQPTSDYCGSSDDFLFIVFKSKSGKDSSGAKFRLKVYVEEGERRDRANIGGIIGGLSGAMTGVVCAIVFGGRYYRKRQMANNCHTSSGTAPNTYHNQQATSKPTQDYGLSQPTGFNQTPPTGFNQTPAGRYSTGSTPAHSDTFSGFTYNKV